VVATTALLVLAAAQLTAAFSTRKGSAVVGVAIAAVLAVAAGFGGAAFAAARDIDVTSATAGAPSKVAGHVGQLSGITVTDAASGAERWHHWERGWSTPYVGLSPDGATAYLVVDRVGEQDAMAFAAATGRLLWQKELQTHPWPRFGGDMSPEYPAGRLAIGPGLAVFVGYNEIRYLDPDGRDGTVRMDVQCGNLLAAGGVRQQLYLVGDCGTGIQVLAADRNARTLWSTKVSMPVTGQFGATVDDRGDRIVVTVGGTATTLDAATGKVE
jgi:outer membrane protein assembly factor BamB